MRETGSKLDKNKRLANLPKGFGIEWISRRKFSLSDYTFNIAVSFNTLSRSVPIKDNYADNVFFLLKTTDIIQRYLSFIRQVQPKRIVQLGVFRGGSVGFLQLLLKPERLLALERDPVRQDFLDRFIEHEGLKKSVHVEYGVDQADGITVERLAREFMGDGRSIDVVFDDASHMLSPTRSSFETLFPMIVPGGAYIVEDFAAAHLLVSEGLQNAVNGGESDRQLFNKVFEHSVQADLQPVHLLAVEAMLAAIVDPGVVRNVVVDRHWLKIVRGGKDLDPTQPFDLRKLAGDHFGLLDSAPDQELQDYLNSIG